MRRRRSTFRTSRSLPTCNAHRALHEREASHSRSARWTQAEGGLCSTARWTTPRTLPELLLRATVRLLQPTQLALARSPCLARLFRQQHFGALQRFGVTAALAGTLEGHVLPGVMFCIWGKRAVQLRLEHSS